jgi:hypothetical protein
MDFSLGELVSLNLESKQALEHGIETGRGGVWLTLTPEQYARLRRAPRRQ